MRSILRAFCANAPNCLTACLARCAAEGSTAHTGSVGLTGALMNLTPLRLQPLRGEGHQSF